MKIVVAANYRLRRAASLCIRSARKLGYSVMVYDLGGLGFGKPFAVRNETFQGKGFYREMYPGRYSYAEHKPRIIKDCLRTCNEFIVYLDADTVLIDRIDEMAGAYDVGLTVRPQWEVESLTRKSIYDAYINAGVMAFNATEAAYRFVKEWECKLAELHNDQGAVNALLKKRFPLKSDQTIKKNGIKIRTFDTRRYNHYYFDWHVFTAPAISISALKAFAKSVRRVRWQNAKILHFKGDTRCYMEMFMKSF